MTNKLYNEKSIESLSPLEFTRLRPGVYCGDTSHSTQLLIEIVSNAVDEFRLGHGDRIIVDIMDDGAVRVRDFGQGFIVNSKREDGTTILEAAFSVLNTSGKYREDGTYEGTSLGSFGIGSKITTYLSHWLIVETARDGKTETITFEEGVFKNRTIGSCEKGISGTVVTWLPSEEFFTDIHVDLNVIKKLFNVIVCLCPGLTINLSIGKENAIEFISKNGLHDLVDQVTKDNEILKNRFVINFTDNKNKLDLVATYTNSYSSIIVPYVNTGLTEAGPHITQIKTLITREMNKFFREKGWLKEKDENLSGEDCQEGLYLVFNITAPNVAYDAQVKSRVTKLDMKPFTQVIAEELQYWMVANEKEIKQIADKALNARKAREAARKAREAARGIKTDKKKFKKFDTKLADCSSKNRKICELYVTEGDSASGNLKKVRDKKTQAVLPIRGKMLNVYKASWEKVQKNAEIMNIIDALGLTINPATMRAEYKPENLRYGIVIIMSDADVDGAHIKNLFYTDMWSICPELIINGHIFAGVPPLYRITMGKKYQYLKDDAELLEFREKNKGRSYEVSRLKGLGEMDLDETEECLIDPNRRIIKRVTVSDIELANKLFDDLMGTSVIPRKEYVLAHAQEAQYGI